MIVSFKHRGLEKFFTANVKSGILAAHAKKLKRILTLLNASDVVVEMNVPGWNLHQLKGDMADRWSVKVNGNWRVTFHFADGNAEVVDYEDYH